VLSENLSASGDPVPRVSVICPVAGAALFLEQTIESVLIQSLADWTLTLVDNGCDCDLEQLARRDARISVIVEPRMGVAIARNAGLREVRTPLVAFIDADDVWLADKLARQCEALDHDPGCAGVYTGFDLIDEAGTYIGPGWAPEEITFRGLCRGEGIITGSNLMLRRSALLEIGLLDELLVVGSDVDFLFRLCRRHRLCSIREVLFHYRTHEQNMTKDYRSAYHAMINVVRSYSHVRADRSRMQAWSDRRAGLRRIRRTYCAQAFDAWRRSPRRRSPAALRHLAVAARIDWRWLVRQARARLTSSAD
jgi:glycosyltransferase involved in cell wall biosynthesis